MQNKLLKRIFKGRYWLALLLPVSCATIEPNIQLGYTRSRTVPPSEVPGLKGVSFRPAWCVRWSNVGLDGGARGYACGGQALNIRAEGIDGKSLYLREEVGHQGIKEGRPITAISLLSHRANEQLAGIAKKSSDYELLENLRKGVVYLNPPDGYVPFTVNDWEGFARGHWDVLKVHHASLKMPPDAAVTVQSRIGSLVFMYVLALLAVFILIDMLRAIS